MAKCPFLSTRYYKQDSISVSAKDVTSSCESCGGSLDWKVEQINAGTDIINGTEITTWVECITTNCQIWDSTNNRCGMLVSNTIKQSTDENNGLINHLENSIGKSSELDSGNSLISYFKNILGISSERDNASSLITYFKNMIGTASERDDNQSATEYWKNLFGIKSERDNDDTNPMSLVTYLKTIVGKFKELGEYLNEHHSFASYTEHIHNQHHHNLIHHIDSGFQTSPTGRVWIGGPPEAVNLMTEYTSNSDRDQIPVATLQTINANISGSIYGFHFSISTADGQCPPVLAGLQGNPSFPQNLPQVTWEQYMDLY